MRPFVAAALAGVAFAAGTLIVVATILSTPRSSRLPTTFFAVALSLSLTSLVLSRWGQVPVARTIIRNVSVGVAAMGGVAGHWFTVRSLSPLIRFRQNTVKRGFRRESPRGSRQVAVANVTPPMTRARPSRIPSP